MYNIPYRRARLAERVREQKYLAYKANMVGKVKSENIIPYTNNRLANRWFVCKIHLLARALGFKAMTNARRKGILYSNLCSVFKSSLSTDF